MFNSVERLSSSGNISRAQSTNTALKASSGLRPLHEIHTDNYKESTAAKPWLTVAAQQSTASSFPQPSPRLASTFPRQHFQTIR